MPLLKSDIRTNADFNQPTLIGYNRLESIPRSSDYGKALRAEVHDALWMLTRQWQMGEFDAEDAGSAIKTRILADHHRMTQMKGKENSSPLIPLKNLSMPLDMVVEREKLLPDLGFRIESGKLFKQILLKNNLKTALNDFILEFNPGLIENAETGSEEDVSFRKIQSEPVVFELYQSLKNRILDGYAAYKEIKTARYEEWANKTFTGSSSELKSAVKAGLDFITQFEHIYGNIDPATWQSERLEYSFSIQDQQGNTIMNAEGYSNGSLDWYDFDIQKPPTKSEEIKKNSFIPTSVTYPGMPKARWWEMEESAVNFGNINVAKPDLLTLLLIDYALIYGNDWMIIPYPMEVNSLCEIKGILVTDVFGYHTFIPPVDSGKGNSWGKWSLFRQSMIGKVVVSQPLQPLFYLVPSMLKTIEQEPLEKISFVRDEMANLVWAFENIIPNALGKGEKAHEIHLRESANPSDITPPNQDAPLKYILGSEIPFYQIPFIPVEVPDSNPQQMRLQRGRMPQGSNPRGILLNESNPAPLYIREEELPRAGVNIIRRWQRTRWINGVPCQWIGREKETGKSEGSNGLKFDQAVY
ncbi:MAG: hypothetical protein NTX61_13435 [Bacteroidetes bacterium]|nr:hypothetical protein [Bacteroidota bacterium]